jgi:hypothetical protein
MKVPGWLLFSGIPDYATKYMPDVAKTGGGPYLSDKCGQNLSMDHMAAGV